MALLARHRPAPPTPTVTVVVVHLDGRDMLLDCLRSVAAQDYPAEQVEVVLVDNASTDGAVEAVREQFPDTVVLRNERNVGFAPAVNQGARAGSGEILALLNDDAVAEPGWLREGVQPMVARGRVVATASLMLSEDGRTVDWAGGDAFFSGHGIARLHGEPVPNDLDPGPVLFACGGAMLARRERFLALGGFDEDYFAYYEDVDFGWRAWLAGHEVWFTPTSRVRHRHSATTMAFGEARKQYLLERNALMTIYKNWSDEALRDILPAAVLLAAARSTSSDQANLPDHRIEMADEVDLDAAELGPYGVANLVALRDFALALPELEPKRTRIQRSRSRSDHDIAPLLRAGVVAHRSDPTYLDVFRCVVDAFDVPLAATVRQEVLVLCADTIAPKMAGPGIRAWEMAKLLSHEHGVTLATVQPPEMTHARFAVELATPERMRDLVARATVIVTQGVMTYRFPEIMVSDAAVVADMYAPFHIEALEHRRHQTAHDRWQTNVLDTRIVNDQLLRGDLLLCASRKQRDFWLGQLTALGRVNPATYDQDPGLHALLEVAPFGLPSDPPEPTRRAIRDEVDGIGDDDLVLVWGGGVYDWFDPSTLIRGVALAAETDPRVKLFFLGVRRPNPDVPVMARALEAMRTAEELGVRDTHVFFNDAWVAYEDRQNYLCDADIGVSTHFLHVETELSFRTRILDYLWTGLPILATEGDSLSAMVAEHDLGEVVRAEDPDDIARAVLALADPARRAACSANVAELAPTLTWERALEPLLAFCRLPRRSPDSELRGRYPLERAGRVGRSPVRLARRFAAIARDQGLKQAALRASADPRLRAVVNRLRTLT